MYVRKMALGGILSNCLRTLASWHGLLVFSTLFLAGCETTQPQRTTGRIGVVVVDAGHGGEDRGARPVFGHPEKALTLDTSRRLTNALRQRGFKVVNTRKGDYFVPLQTRVNIANRIRRNDVLFVSVHYNWAKRPGASGVEVFYNNSHMAQRAAVEVANKLNVVMPSDEFRGAKPAHFHVLRENRKPAILVEPGFVSNASDNRFIQKNANRQRIAVAIADGILRASGGRMPETTVFEPNASIADEVMAARQGRWR